MKYSTIHIGNNKIEIFNSLLGKETIKVNGEVVSSKYSMSGAEHEFTISDDGRPARCKIKFGFGVNGVVFDLYKEENPIVESEKSGCMGFIFVIVFTFIVIILLAVLLKW